MSAVLPRTWLPSRRTTSLLTACVMVLLGAWAVALLDLGAWTSHVSASHEVGAAATAAPDAVPLARRMPSSVVWLVSLAAAVGLGGLLLAATQRGWADTALAGAGLLWAVLFSLGARSVFAAGLMPPWWVMHALLAVALLLTVWYGLQLIQRPTRRLRQPPLLPAVLVGTVATLAYGLAGGGSESLVSWWVPLCGVALGAGTLAQAVDLARRRGVSASRHSVPAWILVAAGALVLGCALHERWVPGAWPMEGEARIGAWYATRMAMLLLLAVMLMLRLAQLARMLRQLGRSHRAWRARLRDAQRELHDLRDRLALRERTDAQRKQRDRILRELHDELGHRLVALQDQSRREGVVGAPDLRQMQQLIDTSLLELRMAYDALEPVPRPLTDALTALREQLAPALSEAGVRLEWSVDARAAMLVLPTAQTLQLQRIVREALDLSQPSSSVVHVGSASAQVALQVLEGETGRHLRLSVREGAGAAAPSGLRGLPLPTGIGPAWTKLQRQATMLGAQLVVEGQGKPGGAAGGLELVMPLGAGR